MDIATKFPPFQLTREHISSFKSFNVKYKKNTETKKMLKLSKQENIFAALLFNYFLFILLN